MYSIKIENGHSAISGSSVKLRTKFIKHFPSLQIQQNVIQTIENLNSSSILDIFKFLMKAGASEDYLAQETHLEWAELTQEQSKMIWNEIVLKSTPLRSYFLMERSSKIPAKVS